MAESKEIDLKLIASGALIATPDVKLHKIDVSDEFIIIASDGLWDVMSNQQAVNYVRNQIAGGYRLQQFPRMLSAKHRSGICGQYFCGNCVP